MKETSCHWAFSWITNKDPHKPYSFTCLCYDKGRARVHAATAGSMYASLYFGTVKVSKGQLYSEIDLTVFTKLKILV